MATKPTVSLARFADGGGADVTAPSSGLRDTGFVAGTAIVQSFVNYLLNQLYQWALYLSEGALSGNHTIAGTLATAEALTVGGQPLVFADFAYTADAGTDTLTATAHGRETGDGAARTTNSGGGLPGGLAINTDYYFIRTGANTFKLATTRANALAGIAIDITSNGTGTHTLIDQSGTTRVSDALVTRNLQVDGVLTANSHGDKTLNIPPYSLMSTTATPNTGNVALGTADAFLGIPLHQGDRIKSIDISVSGNSSADVDIILHVNTATGGQSAPSGGSATVTNPGSTATTTINPTDTVLGAGETFRLQFTPNATGIAIGNVRVTYDRPVT